MTSFKPSIPSEPKSLSVFLPGINTDAQILSEQLLLRNNKEFHIFFNERKFHNHLAHHILAAYSFGATKERLQEIFDYQAKDQRPIPPLIGEITRENYKEYLGNGKAYTSFLNFFESEIEKNGVVNTIRRWVWSGDFLARCVGSLYHAMIHIGYGIEFHIPGMVAEGLSMAACTDLQFNKILPTLPDIITTSLLPVQAQIYAENYSSTAKGIVSQFIDNISHQFSYRLGISDPVSSNQKEIVNNQIDTFDFFKTSQIIHILDTIRNDSTFNFLTKDNATEPEIIFSNKKAMERIKYYSDQWVIKENTENIQEKLKELYTAITILVGGTSVKTGYPGVLRVNFSLMHSLTSIEFVHQFVNIIAPSEAVLLLNAHFAVTLFYFVYRGRPTIDIDALLNYRSKFKKENRNNDWLTVFDRSLDCQEAHIIKTVRSCAVGQVIYGSSGNPLLDSIWLRVAEMACDSNGDWDFSAPGFEETWENFNNSKSNT